MKRYVKIFFVWLCFLMFFSFTAIPVGFCDKAVSAGKLNIVQRTRSTVKQYGATAGKVHKWTELKLEFTTRVQWVDELTVKYFVLVTSEKNSDILSGEITYINVPAGKNHMSSLFIHPDTMLKYGGKVQALHCEIWAGGKSA